MKRLRVAVVGATGAVGREMTQVLAKRSFPVKKLRLLASKRSAGKTMDTPFGKLVVEELTEEALAGLDLALFAAGSGVAGTMAPLALAQGAVVVDNSSAFRMDPSVPLVVPEVNPDAMTTADRLIANPNCSTILLLVVLAPLARALGLRRVIVSTYQAVSGVGQKGLDALRRETERVLAGEKPMPSTLPFPSAARHRTIAFNLVPQVDRFAEDGYTKEEWKMVDETRKILAMPDLPITATTVRVPVFRSHAESVYIETETQVDLALVREILGGAQGVEVVDNPDAFEYPTPLDSTDRGEILVGRIRRDLGEPRAVNLWLVGDQLLKGAALNAVQIAEKALAGGWWSQ